MRENPGGMRAMLRRKMNAPGYYAITAQCRMCTVAFAWKTHPRWRLVLAGNRDEFHARPTAPLAAWAEGGLLAGRDLQSGGTWVGLGPAGRVAVVTNVRDGRAAQVAGPSRGALPAGFLSGRDAALAHAEALAENARHYAPFNLVLADATGCALLGNHPATAAQAIPPGVHGVSNGPFDAPWPKTRRLRAAVRAWVDAGSDDLQPLWDALADEHPAPDAELPDTGVGLALERLLSPAFIRGHEYGTRASTLVAVDHDGRGWIHERRFGPDGVFVGETRLALDATA